MAEMAGDEKPSNVINLKDALSERYLALLEWQGTLRVRLGPAFDF